MRKLIVVLAVVFSASAFAQNVTIGTLPQTASALVATSPATFVDLTHPATDAGSINTVIVHWLINGNSCSNAFKVKFIHRNTSGTGFSVIERGPFTATKGYVTVQISPPVDVSLGDSIGITLLQPLSSCGGVTYAPSDPSQLLWKESGDLGATGDFSNGTFIAGETLSAVGRSGSEYLAGVVPAAGATQGVGAFFRTAMQL
ncbi:MAG TPA: hypothetical protein VHU41_10145, partial [Thermoanaerobaculia bacterium]|nr:hypothetical protein [Thermoanaerobaculia bacterium]